MIGEYVQSANFDEAAVVRIVQLTNLYPARRAGTFGR
jgi:hypothetical protein